MPTDVAELSPMVEKLSGKLTGWAEGMFVMLPNLLLAVVVVVIAVPAARWVEAAVSRVLLRITDNRPISQLLATASRICVVVMGLFFALELLKLDKTVTSLLAGVGVVGLALGFAFQDIAANFMSGIMMALHRPFDVNDLVQVGGHQGRVLSVALRATALETFDGRSVLIPNREIFQNPIVNFTQTPQRRMEFKVGTAYCDDMTKVQRVITNALGGLSGRQPDRPVDVLFESFGDSSIEASVLVWLNAADEITYRRCRSDAMIAVKQAFDREGITIPFPIRTLDFGSAVVGGVRFDQLGLSSRIVTPRGDSEGPESGEN